MAERLTDQFLAYLKSSRKLSPHTIATYSRTYRTFPNIETAQREDVEAWWDTRTHLSTATRLNELAAVRSFYKWCRRWEHRGPTDDPTYRIEPPKLPRAIPRPIPRADLLTLLRVLEGDLRRAVCLGAYAGLRVSEAAALDWRDVDTETHRIRVTGKGGKTRLTGLPPILLDAILPNTGGNVVTAGGRAYPASVLQRKVNRAIRAASVDATFHQLRHRFGTMALTSANLLSVARAMGHESTATTAIYAATSDADLDLIGEAVTR